MRCSYLVKVDMDIETTTLAIIDGPHEALVSLAKDVGRRIDEAFAVAGFLAGYACY